MTCASCSGTGKLRAVACPGFRLVEMPCEACGGDGQNHTRPEWREQGALHQALRASRDESMGEVARRLGVSVVLISKAERGLAELPAAALAEVQALPAGFVAPRRSMLPAEAWHR